MKEEKIRVRKGKENIEIEKRFFLFNCGKALLINS